MNYLTARLYALAGVPIGRSSTAADADSLPTEWISFEKGRWRRSVSGVSAPLDLDDLGADDYMATDWQIPPNWSCIPAIVPQPDFPANPYLQTTPTFNPLDPRCNV